MDTIFGKKTFPSSTGWTIFRHPSLQATIEAYNPRKIPAYNSEERYYALKVRTRKGTPYKIGGWSDELINGCLLKLIDTINRQLTNPKSFYNISIEFNSTVNFRLPFRQIKNGLYSVNDLLEKILEITQSGEILTIDTILITVKIVHYKVGHNNDRNEGYIQLKPGFASARIRTDYLQKDTKNCVFLATAYANLHRRMKQGLLTEPESKLLKNTGAVKLILEEGKRIANAANLEFNNCNAGHCELKKIEDVISYRLVVYQIHNNDGASNQENHQPYARLFYRGEKMKQGTINLVLKGETYIALTLPGSIIQNFDKVCPACALVHPKKKYKDCLKLCNSCWTSTCKAKPDTIPSTKCSDCSLFFKGAHCLESHKRSGTCKRLKHCNKCNKNYNEYAHRCHLVYCKRCSTSYNPMTETRHVCYLKPYKPKAVKNTVRVYFDYEATLSQDENHKFIPVSLVSLITCNHCSDKINKNIEFTCDFCSGEPALKKFVFDGTENKNISRDFIKYLIDVEARLIERYKKSYRFNVYAHNSGRFDSHFLLHALLEHCETELMGKHPILNGRNILSLPVGKNIRILDTLNLIPVSLKNLPKALGLEEICGKGYFPYRFLTPTNLNYIGEIPAKEFFEYNEKSQEEKKLFDQWYNEEKLKEFNIKNELLKYNTNDVVVLAKCFEEFHRIIEREFKADAFHPITIASLAFNIFLQNHLKEKTIPIIDKQKQKQTSTIAEIWLMYLMTTENIQIQTSKSYFSEKLIKVKDNKTLSVDGFCHETNTVFNFKGCFYHQHAGCKKAGRYFSGADPNAVYQKTLHEEELIKQAGYTLRSTWECEFNKLENENPQAKEIIDECRRKVATGRLNPKEALYGGKTAPARLLCELPEGPESIFYVDFTSLYPYVQSKYPFPIGPPNELFGDRLPSCEEFNSKDTEYFGLVYCDLLPPDNVIHPKIPYRCKKKLLFPLCNRCSFQQTRRKCKHTNEERTLRQVTLCTPELYAAISQGYKVTKLYHIWDFVKSPCGINNPDGIFTRYVYDGIKGKMQASGWPSDVTTEDEKDKYIKEIYDSMYIKLEKNKIKKNPGLRFCFKLLLNSLWGKLAQESVRSETHFISSYDELLKIFNDIALSVSDIYFTNNRACVKTTPTSEMEASSHCTNYVIAAFVTCYGRLELGNLLDSLGTRVLYYDTDSCVFTGNPSRGDFMPKLGKKLGDLTDEISDQFGPGAKCFSFVSTGPKCYSMKIVLPNGETKQIIKSKGITINNVSETIVNYDGLRDLVRNQDAVKQVPTTNFVRKDGGNIYLVDSTKKLSYTYDKGMIINTDQYYTCPWGMKNPELFFENIDDAINNEEL